MSLLITLFAALVIGYFIWRFFTSKWQEVFITQDVEQFMMVSEALAKCWHPVQIHYWRSGIQRPQECKGQQSA